MPEYFIAIREGDRWVLDGKATLELVNATMQLCKDGEPLKTFTDENGDEVVCYHFSEIDHHQSQATVSKFKVEDGEIKSIVVAKEVPINLNDFR